MTVVCHTPQGERRYRIQLSDHTFALHDDTQSQLIVQATRGSRERGKIFGCIPLPRIRTWTFRLPTTGDEFVIAETWPVTVEMAGQRLHLSESPAARGIHYHGSHFECLVREWASIGNVDTDFAWESERWHLPAILCAAYLRYQLHLRTSS